MWTTVEEFRKRTNISILDNTEIEYFLNVAKRIVAEYIFIYKKLKINTVDKSYKIDLRGSKYVADYFSYDGTVDKNDLKVYELDTTTYIETDISSDITSFQSKYGFVKFSNDHPTTENNICYLEYYQCRFEWTEIYDKIKLLQRLITIREMLMEKPAAAEAVLSGNVTLVGFTFDAGMGNREAVYKNINLQIDRLISELQPLQITSRDILFEDNPFPFRRF